jgi:DNA polymerase-3 subunit gamma/tau
MSAPAPDAAPAAVVPAPAPAVAAPPPAAAVPAESAAPALPATAATGAAVASPAAPAPDPPPLNPPGETPILPQEAAAAAASASLVPKVVTNGDPATDDEALAVEVALSMLKPVSSNPVSPKGEHLDEVHPLADPPRDDAGPKE